MVGLNFVYINASNGLVIIELIGLDNGHLGLVHDIAPARCGLISSCDNASHVIVTLVAGEATHLCALELLSRPIHRGLLEVLHTVLENLLLLYEAGHVTISSIFASVFFNNCESIPQIFILACKLENVRIQVVY